MGIALAHPGLFLAGAACVAIPILIHLFMRRRRRPIRWGAMRFLLEAYRQQRRRIRLEQFVLLALRCALVVLIALAVGRPAAEALSGQGRSGPVTLYVLVDNGLCAGARDGSGSRALDRHLESARAMVSRLDQSRGDRAAVVTLASPVEGVVLPPSSDLSAVRAALDRIEGTESVSDLGGAAALVRDQRAGSEGAVTVAVLSDFRAGSADVQRALPTLSAGSSRPRVLATRPAGEGLTNLTVLSAEPLSPVLLRSGAGSSPVRVTVRRDGSEVGEARTTAVRVRLTRPGEESASSAGVIRWSPGQTVASVTIQAEMPPARAGVAEDVVVRASVDADAIAGDNDLFRRVVVRDSIVVALIAERESGASAPASPGPAEWVSLALEPVSASRWSGDGAWSEVKVRRVDPLQLDGAALAGADAAFVLSPDQMAGEGWERLRRFVEAGGLVVVFPAREVPPASWAPGLAEGLGVSWSVGSEARVFDPPASLVLEGAGVQTSVLARLGGELAELIRPVSVRRAIEIGGSGWWSSGLRVGGVLPLAVVEAPGGGVEGSRRGSRGLAALVALSPDLSWTDLPAKPLMVPLVQELLRVGVGRSAGSASAVAGGVPVLPTGAVSVRAVDGPAVGAWGAGARSAGGVLTRAGVYRVEDERGGSLGLITVDADAGGALVETRTEGEVGAWLSGLGGVVEWLNGGEWSGWVNGSSVSEGRGSGSWSAWLFVCAAVVGLAELALSRLFSHASASRGVGVPASPAGVAA